MRVAWMRNPLPSVQFINAPPPPLFLFFFIKQAHWIKTKDPAVLFSAQIKNLSAFLFYLGKEPG